MDKFFWVVWNSGVFFVFVFCSICICSVGTIQILYALSFSSSIITSSIIIAAFILRSVFNKFTLSYIQFIFSLYLHFSNILMYVTRNSMLYRITDCILFFVFIFVSKSLISYWEFLAMPMPFLGENQNNNIPPHDYVSNCIVYVCWLLLSLYII